MKLKLALISAFSSSLLWAQDISLDWIESKPKTFARDFYIWQYLKQENVSAKNAMDALGLVHNMNNKLLFSYVNKLNHDESTAVIQCMKAQPKQLLKNNKDCILLGLSLRKAEKLDALQLDSVIDKIKSSDELFTKKLKILNSPIAFSKAISAPKKVFFDIFSQTSRKFRENRLNYKIPSRALKRLSSDKRFEKIIKLSVTNPKMALIQQSFFELDDEKYSVHTSFLLAMNALIHKKEQIALKYLNSAYAKAYSQSLKDKIVFWKYQITQDKSLLKTLNKSLSVNIYTLFAKEVLHTKFDNLVFKVSQNFQKPSIAFDRTNQFDWISVLRDTREVTDKKLKEYEKVFSTKETLPQLTYLYTKYNKYQRAYFINPYKELLKGYSTNRQVLINAIARQESQFIPSSISTSYAQGVMQIMPFLSKAIAKQQKEPYDILNMFNPEYSIKYANLHLNALEKRFEHPLFIAYAYNGGGGFLRSVLKNGLFEKGKFEPYLSMERIPYTETREYGKKVLSNYLIYHNHMNKKKKLTFTALLKSLQKPSMKK
jgi:soluble lytic murein transglycosylase